MTYADALNNSKIQLEQHFCSDGVADREAEALLAKACGVKSAAILLKRKKEITEDQAQAFSDLCQRRVAHEPLAYLLGDAPFLGRSFLVSNQTLIPRPATELIVERVLMETPPNFAGTMVDVGTGTGCIAISCALNRAKARVIATDWSDTAIEVAKKNALTHGVEDRVEFVHTNGLDAVQISWSDGVVLISNLPYLPDGMWHTLSPDITLYEPRLALVSGADGMDAYRALAEDLVELVPKDAPITVAWELLPEQVETAKRLIGEALPWLTVEPITNYQDVVVGVMAK